MKLLRVLLSPLLRFINENKHTASGLAIVFITKSIFEYISGKLLTGVRVPDDVFATTDPVLFYSVIIVQLVFSLFIVITLLWKNRGENKF